MLARGSDVLEVLGLLLVHLSEHALEQHVREADDGVERRAQLVRHVREELALVAVGDLELAALVLDLAEEAGVLDRERRLAGEGLEQLDRRGRKGSRRLPHHHQRPEDPVLAQQRDGQECSKPRPHAELAQGAPDTSRLARCRRSAPARDLPPPAPWRLPRVAVESAPRRAPGSPAGEAPRSPRRTRRSPRRRSRKARRRGRRWS